jgi:hypothetical protein
MNDLFCLKSDLTSNYRNKVKESLILNAHALYFYWHQIYSKQFYSQQVYLPSYLISSNSPSFFTLQQIAKPSFVIDALMSSPRRYLLCLPFW